MSRRLQVMLPDVEMAEIRRVAKRERMPVSEWVRRVLRQALDGRPRVDARVKLTAVRRAAEYSFPTADIGKMIQEIERGYQG